MAHKNSVFKKFGDGNKETLKLDKLSKYLKDFYEKYYNANLMKLVV